MAIANTKSTIVTNADAVSSTPTSSYINGGRIIEQAAKVSVLAADDDLSVYRLFRIPSNARVSSLQLQHDAITGGTDYNLGLYDNADDGGAVVDDNAFADALDLSSARAVDTEVQSAVAEEDREKRIWEVLGLSADPAKQYDVALTAITVGTAQGDIAAKCQYAI